MYEDLEPGMSKRRIKAVQAYYENPVKCKYCDCVIEVQPYQPVFQVKEKKFCNSTCAANYNGLGHHYRIAYVSSRTKGELIAARNTRVNARIGICRDARTHFMRANKNPVCKVCGYDKVVEVCHIKAVADWSDDTLLSVINDLSNLVGLCPNHHWEFDHGLLTF